MERCTAIHDNLPTRQQELLLRAALLEGDEARHAWMRWQSSVDIEKLDAGSNQLLPLLYRNLRKMGTACPEMSRFKGVYRHTWYKNQLLFHDCTPVLSSFREAGIETVLLKGAGLAAEHYRDFGLRAMADFDVLVPFEKASAAISLLKALGWLPEFDFSDKVLQRYIASRHSCGFTSPSGSAMDLHWHVLQDHCRKDDDMDFWEGSREIRVHHIPTRILDPADQLLHVCLHGAIWNPVPTLRWIADAVTIVKASPEMDWERLAAGARRRERTLTLRQSLEYLREKLDLAIPEAVVRALETAAVSRAERLEHAALTSSVQTRGPFLSFWLRYRWHVRSELGCGLLSRFVTFPRFLQFIWRRENLLQVPLYGCREGCLRIWNLSMGHARRGAKAAPLLQ
jgi:hypothetical protein